MTSSAPQAPHDAVAWHSAIAGAFHDRYATSPMFRERLEVWGRVLEARIAPGDTVLDLGCGSGILSVAAARRARRVIAVDGSAEMVEQARRTGSAAGASNILFVQARLEEYRRHTPGGADAIVCSSVIEYLEHPDAFLADCAASLRGGGKLLVSLPNRDSWYRRCERLAFRVARRPRYLRYVRFMETREAFAERLRRHGFAVLGAETFGRPPGVPNALASRARRAHFDTMVLFAAVRN